MPLEPVQRYRKLLRRMGSYRMANWLIAEADPLAAEWIRVQQVSPESQAELDRSFMVRDEFLFK